jgi:hypothetical protein
MKKIEEKERRRDEEDGPVVTLGKSIDAKE